MHCSSDRLIRMTTFDAPTTNKYQGNITYIWHDILNRNCTNANIILYNIALEIQKLTQSLKQRIENEVFNKLRMHETNKIQKSSV